MNIIIRGGRIIDPEKGVDAVGDVVIDGDRITRVEIGGLREFQEMAESGRWMVLYAGGCVVCPGFVDLHTHLREPGLEDQETIATGTLAAARGGYTTVCCMPNTKPAIDNRATVEYVKRVAEAEGKVRVLPIAAITKGRVGAELTEMGELVATGVVGFSDDGKSVPSSLVLRHAFEYARMFGLPIIEHCEDVDTAGVGVMNEGMMSNHLGLHGIPGAAEEIIVARDIALAELTGGWLHVAHVSTERSVELIRQAKRRGVRVTAEVTPHHLVMTEDWVGGRRGAWGRAAPYDTNTKVNPPLRSERDRLALVDGLKDGTIDAIATDHAPHTVVDKLCEYDLAPFGISGLETALGCLLTLINLGELDLRLTVAKLTSGPAQICGLGPVSLSPEARADVTVFSPHSEWTVNAHDFASKGWNTPLDGLKLPGRVVYTIANGSLVYDGRKNEREGGSGA